MFFWNQKNTEKRVYPRVSFREPVSFRFSDIEEAGGCLSQDLSEGGIRVNFNHFVRPDTPISLSLRLRGGRQVFLVDGRVAWAQHLSCSDRYQLGIEFSKASVSNQRDIKRYIEAAQVR